LRVGFKENVQPKFTLLKGDGKNRAADIIFASVCFPKNAHCREQ